MTDHARHQRESLALHQERAARAAQLIPGSPAWDRHLAAGHGEPQEAPEVLANRGLWADSGGLFD